MPGYQKIIVVGHVGREPELRYFPDGGAVCNLSLGTSKKIKGVSHTTWFKVSLWGKSAESANQYITKGAAILVEGELKSGPDGNPVTFTRRDGTTGASYEITGDRWSFMGNKRDDDDSNGQVPVGNAPVAADDDDAPF